MARNLDPKCKQCRREGEKLFLKGERCFTPKCPIVKRNYPPGQHGLQGRTRTTGYGLQLREKQKVKRMYRLLEQQFSNYFRSAAERKGNTADMFLQSLETRLDNVVYRMGFAKSRDHSRQLIGHGHVLVNGKYLNVPSYSVQPGDVISIHEKSKQMTHFADVQKAEGQQSTVPSWMEVDPAALSGTVKSIPEGKELQQGIQVQLIVEFYSR